MIFTKLGNGNVILNNEKKLSATAAIRKDPHNANNVIITDQVMGNIIVDYTTVTAPVVATRDELFTKLVTDFFF